MHESGALHLPAHVPTPACEANATHFTEPAEQSWIGRPHLVSIDGKYEVGPSSLLSGSMIGAVTQLVRLM